MIINLLKKLLIMIRVGRERRSSFGSSPVVEEKVSPAVSEFSPSVVSDEPSSVDGSVVAVVPEPVVEDVKHQRRRTKRGGKS